MPNADRIRRVIGRIELNQKKWNQEIWGGVGEAYEDGFREKATLIHDPDLNEDFYILKEGICGTSFCFAGHAVLEAGDTIYVYPDDLSYADTCRTPEGEILGIEERARQLLDLSLGQASALFDGSAGGGNLEAYKRLVTEKTGVTFD